MPNAAATLRPDRLGRLAAAARARPMAALAALALALTAWRLGWLALNRTDLFVDEAQYWFWSTELDFGYFSKPPLIAWVIRLATEIGGDATAFWVRAPAPLLHAAAAFAVAAAGARAFDPVTGALAGAAWLTLPAVTLGSQVISTDTVMLPFFAAAVWLWLRLSDRPSRLGALALGAALGLAFLAKYAAAYLIPFAALAALLRPGLRLTRGDAVAAGLAFLALAGLNLGWNALNGGVTLAHTAHNAGPASAFPDLAGLAAFWGAQAGVMGPVLLAGFLAALAARAPGAGPAALRWVAVPVLALVSVQALRAGANANWAAAAYVGATPLAVAWLRDRPRWLAASFALHGLVALALPMAAAAPDWVRAPGGRPAFARVMGQAALAQELTALAQAQGARAILADNRGVLAALLHAQRAEIAAGRLSVHAPRPVGAPANHFEMAAPLPETPSGPVLWVSTRARTAPPPGFAALTPVGTLRPETGFMAGRTLHLHLLTPP